MEGIQVETLRLGRLGHSVEAGLRIQDLGLSGGRSGLIDNSKWREIINQAGRVRVGCVTILHRQTFARRSCQWNAQSLEGT